TSIRAEDEFGAGIAESGQWCAVSDARCRVAERDSVDSNRRERVGPGNELARRVVDRPDQRAGLDVVDRPLSGPAEEVADCQERAIATDGGNRRCATYNREVVRVLDHLWLRPVGELPPRDRAACTDRGHGEHPVRGGGVGEAPREVSTRLERLALE